MVHHGIGKGTEAWDELDDAIKYTDMLVELIDFARTHMVRSPSRHGLGIVLLEQVLSIVFRVLSIGFTVVYAARILLLRSLSGHTFLVRKFAGSVF